MTHDEIEQRQRLADIVRDACKIRDQARSANRELTPEERAKIVKLLERAEGMKAALETTRLETWLQQPEPIVGSRAQPCNEAQPLDPPPAQHRADRWIDKESGREVRCFRRGERLTDAVHREHPEARDLSFGRAIRALVAGSWRGAEAEQRAMSGFVNSGGGYLVPNPLSAVVIDRARDLSVLWRLNPQTIEMTSQTLQLARVTGDVTFTAKSEGAAFTPSDLVFDNVLLSAFTIGTVACISRELAEDAINGAETIENAMAAALAAAVDKAALFGTGAAGDPEGIALLAGVQSMPAIGSVTWDDLLDADENVLDTNGVATGWCTTPLLITALRKLKSGDGLTSAALYLEPPPAIANLPGLASNAVTTGSILYGNFEECLIGLRTEPTIEVSHDVRFAEHQIAIKATWRVGWNHLHSEHLCHLTGCTA